jgi:uncharacterized membrane protein
MDLSFDQAPWVAYTLVFCAAAIPVVEILIVIPAGIAAGLSPLAVGTLALAGNVSTVVLVVVAAAQIAAFVRRRRARRGTSHGETTPSRRAARAQRMMHRWGLPGLAFVAPLVTGTHLAALAAVALRAPRGAVLVWMTAGLACWALAATVLTVVGLGFV